MSDLIYVAIIACELGFWVVLLAGLSTRYILSRQRLSVVLLAGVPLVDLLLLAFTVIDLNRGGTATSAHGLAAIYVGVSVAFGHRLIHWTDERFSYWFADGPTPSKSPKSGQAHARHQRRQWGRHLLAWAIGCALLVGAVALIGDFDRTRVLTEIARLWTVVLGIDFIWSFSYTLWPRG